MAVDQRKHDQARPRIDEVNSVARADSSNRRHRPAGAVPRRTVNCGLDPRPSITWYIFAPWWPSVILTADGALVVLLIRVAPISVNLHSGPAATRFPAHFVRRE